MTRNQPAVQNPVLYWVQMIFGLKFRVNQRVYFCVGFSLMLFKYLVEAAVIYATTGLFYQVFHFLIPSLALRAKIFEESPEWLPWAIVIWSLPFLWIAVSMSARRCWDIGISPMWSMLILLPVFNYLLMFSLAIPRSDEQLEKANRVVDDEEQDPEMTESHRRSVHMLGSAFAGIVVGGLFAVLLTAISVYAIESYGGALFLGMPMVSGVAAAFVYNQPYLRGLGGSIMVAMLSCVLGGLFLILFAMEGAVCLLMAAPLVLPVGILGGVLGYGMSALLISQSKWMLGGAGLVLAVPLMAVVEKSFFGELPVRVVESSIVIDAPREEVWQDVIAFPDITEEPDWMFQYGVASPVRARIEGEGVGATRYCEFTTGSFVEPITVWDAPSHLAFDVVDQPEPLKELTPYRHIHPPHLHGTFLSVRGEFQLVELPGNRTELIGRTWYTVDMGPSIYWKNWTDFIIHRIHMRVLSHIKRESESGGNAD